MAVFTLCVMQHTVVPLSANFKISRSGDLWDVDDGKFLLRMRPQILN